MLKLTAVLLLTITILSFTSTDRPREIQGDNYTGYIFAKHPYDRNKSFIPSPTEIHAAESILNAKIVAILASDFDLSEGSLIKKQKIALELPNYKRRYFGYTNTVKKKILLIEFVHSDLLNGDEWKQQKWSIDGGGHRFWAIRFNTSSGLFYDLWINEDIEPGTSKKKRQEDKKE